jgi:hypothetical protein
MDKGLPYVNVFLEAQPGIGAESGKCRDQHDPNKIDEDPYEGRMVPFAPPSGISLFLSDCVDASP